MNLKFKKLILYHVKQHRLHSNSPLSDTHCKQCISQLKPGGCAFRILSKMKEPTCEGVVKGIILYQLGLRKIDEEYKESIKEWLEKYEKVNS